MADPTGYDRDYSFSGFQANAPATPLPGQQVDIQLDKVSASITTIVDAIRDVRRPDGKLRNGIVTAESLSPDLTLGIRPPAEWQAGVEYKAGDTVFVDVGFYRALADHVSTDFAANLAAGLWELFADMSQIIANAEIQPDQLVGSAAFGRSLLSLVDDAAARAAIGAVNKAGDTMTGALRVPTTLFVDADDSSADAHLYLCDETGVSRGAVYWDRALDQVWLVLYDATGALVNSIRLSATGATIGTSPIWTDANKQIADGQVLGNVSGSTGVPVGVTLSALLDKISSTRGAVLYRGASGWAALGAGTVGQVLTSGGAGADPSWQNAAAAAVDPLIPPEFVAGLTLSNNAGDPNNDIDIAPGRARGNGVTVEISSTITKRLDANWSEGDGEGGLDTGSKAANATYHVFVIRKDDDGTGDVLLSTSATSPTVPVGWTRVQRLGAVLTDGSGNIRPFVQDGNKFMHNVLDGVQDYSGTSVRALSPLTVTVPDGVRVEGIFSGNITAADGDARVILEVYDGSNQNVRNRIVTAASTGKNQLVAPIEQFTNTTRQVWLAIQGAPHPIDACKMHTLGWIDYQIPRIG